MRARLAVVVTALAVFAAGCFAGQGSVGPRDYIQSKTYTSWVIEVDAQQGASPSDALLGFLDGRISAHVDKPDGVSFQRSGVLPGGSKTWSVADIEAFAAEHRNVKTEGATVTTHMLFLRGGTSEDSGGGRVLGITIGYDLIAIFPDNIAASCDQVPLGVFCSTEPIARATSLHEFGHALGLVDRGTPMVRNHEATTCGDRADEKHSSNQNSVMYCAVETNQVALLFGDEPPQDFDSDDKADLRAVREA